MLVLCVKHMLCDLLGKFTHVLGVFKVGMIYRVSVLKGHLNNCFGPKLDYSLSHWNFDLHGIVSFCGSVLRLSSTMLGILTFLYLELKLQQVFLLEV